MKTLLLILILALTIPGSFKDNQKRYARVRQAYTEKETIVKKLLSENEIETKNLRIYLQAFKSEKKIELWAKNKTDQSYKLITEFDICAISGDFGPKRQQGDGQIPEGFYKINVFNPASNFYLSLGTNYPNKSDRILGVKGDLGGDIFIHGNCVTIGCMPITDDKIKELYIFCVEARDNGQQTIPVTIFPAKLTDTNFKTLITKYYGDDDKTNLWGDLKVAYDYFTKNKKLPTVTFLDNGRHKISTD
ncbi:MAG: L,D-transpeptidase family protein [Bacteroidales bacterium]|nr:L,D-transpeptidase family protein [Bacteroidales bacterium]